VIIYTYDDTFEGLLTCVFDAYSSRRFPDMLMVEGDDLPLFYDTLYNVVTQRWKAERVWEGLRKKLSPEALSQVALCFMADGEPKVDELIFRYIRKVFDHGEGSIEVNFADPDVLRMSRVYRQVTYEAERMRMFVRFQKAADGTYFAPFDPVHNVLPLAISHFRDRFRDQRWVIYDVHRGYGFHYDLHEVQEITFGSEEEFLRTGLLDAEHISPDEKLLQDMWKAYFKHICIPERMNPRKHRKDLPVRYWKYLTEKQK